MKIVQQTNEARIFSASLLIICMLGIFQVDLNAQIFRQAEDYSTMSGVQTQGTSDEGGGLNVGWIDNNDWMQYYINFPITGEYVMSIRTASSGGGGVLDISTGGNSLATINIGSTGGWQNWETIESEPFSIDEGGQTIKLKALSGGFNLNWFELRITNPEDSDLPGSPDILNSSADGHSIYLDWSTCFDETTTVTGYKVYANDMFYSFASDTSFMFSKLPPETEINLSIVACDLAGNQSTPSEATISTTALDWELVWSDEFDGDEVDLSKWNYETGGHGWGNGEAQYYTSGANSSVSNGTLIIEARQETIGNNDYTSSRMNNADKGDFLYGRIEVRAKLPSTGGTWPAIWTLPTDWIYGGWPDCGEIDIMEHTGNNLGYVFGTIHTGAYNHMDGTAQSGGTWYSDVVNTFHTYTLEWYPDHMDWYYDDQIVFTFENEYNTYAEWPYDIEHHLMLNIAVGGGLGGTIDHNGEWPQHMYIDYVRIYDFDLGAGDTIPPENPPYLQAEVMGINVELSWSRSTDNNYVEKYYIYKNDVLLDSSNTAKFLVTNLEPLTDYTFSVQAKDFGGNLSGKVSVNATTEEAGIIEIPGKFEAEDYLYMEGMQTENCTDIGGGLNVGYIDPGDWLEYNIQVADEGKYFLTTRTAAQSLTGSFQLLDENQNVLTTVQTPVTGGWQVWKTVVSEGFDLEEGVQRIRIHSLAKDFNFNWFALSMDSTQYMSSAGLSAADNFSIYPNPLDGNAITMELKKRATNIEVCIYTIDGQMALRRQYNNVDNKIFIKNLGLDSGVYLVVVNQDEAVVINKLIVK